MRIRRKFFAFAVHRTVQGNGITVYLRFGTVINNPGGY